VTFYYNKLPDLLKFGLRKNEIDNLSIKEFIKMNDLYQEQFIQEELSKIRHYSMLLAIQHTNEPSDMMKELKQQETGLLYHKSLNDGTNKGTMEELYGFEAGEFD
jgi:hypothetical protein